jgi:hypothetical protein
MVWEIARFHTSVVPLATAQKPKVLPQSADRFLYKLHASGGKQDVHFRHYQYVQSDPTIPAGF